MSEEAQMVIMLFAPWFTGLVAIGYLLTAAIGAGCDWLKARVMARHRERLAAIYRTCAEREIQRIEDKKRQEGER